MVWYKFDLVCSEIVLDALRVSITGYANPLYETFFMKVVNRSNAASPYAYVQTKRDIDKEFHKAQSIFKNLSTVSKDEIIDG